MNSIKIDENIENIVLITSSVSTFIAVTVSVMVIYMHQRNFTQPYIQSKVVGILWMVPIYSICSYLSLLFPDVALYIDLCRDCYEAYVLYLFLALMLAYLNGTSKDDEYEIILYMEAIPTRYPPLPFRLCFPDPSPKGRPFLRQCKFGVLQYCVIRPITTTLAVILDVCGLYGESDFNLHEGFLYTTVITNLSVAYAFYTLASFYYAMKSPLKPFDPVPKFLCIKAIIFFSFWQGVVIAIAVKTKLITDIGPLSGASLSNYLRNFLSCLEMFVFSVLYAHAFSFRPFVNNKRTSSPSSNVIDTVDMDMYLPLGRGLDDPDWTMKARNGNGNGNGNGSISCSRAKSSSDHNNTSGDRNRRAFSLSDFLDRVARVGPQALSLTSAIDLDRHFAHKTALRDFNDSMPMVLPSDFTPSRGRSIPSNPEDRLRGLDLADRPRTVQHIVGYVPPVYAGLDATNGLDSKQCQSTPAIGVSTLSGSVSVSNTSTSTSTDITTTTTTIVQSTPIFSMDDSFDF
eukprot:gene1613-3112_t